ncbi:hypothetical protein BDR06DRAFT_974248 [Suillus hirtellus]|nr:hypothetical protein BDR06DRAFT_974248 [Suillus hirtellus]
MGNVAATILSMPVTIDHIRSTSVDGIVNGVDVKAFINNFSSQAKSQITLADISVAMDVTILAIPGLGILPTKEDNDADHHYKYTDLTSCTKVLLLTSSHSTLNDCSLLVLVIASHGLSLSRTQPQ